MHGFAVKKWTWVRNEKPAWMPIKHYYSDNRKNWGLWAFYHNYLNSFIFLWARLFVLSVWSPRRYRDIGCCHIPNTAVVALRSSITCSHDLNTSKNFTVDWSIAFNLYRSIHWFRVFTWSFHNLYFFLFFPKLRILYIISEVADFIQISHLRINLLGFCEKNEIFSSVTRFLSVGAAWGIVFWW